MPKLRTALTILPSIWFLAACSSEPTCDYSSAPYVSAQSVPSLRAPEGLSLPDRTATLTIPPPEPNAKPMPSGKSRCLDRPPSYFATTPKPGAADKEKEKDKDKKDK